MDPKDNDFNYDYKAVSGVAAFLSNIKKDAQAYRDESPQSSSINTASAAYLKACCDTGSRSNGPRAINAPSQSYYCDACDIELTSEIVYEQHINGSRHAKKVRNLALLKQGEGGADVAKANQGVPGPSGKKKAKVISLRDVLASSSDSIIGLGYIEECLPETDSTDFEPMYTCGLCCVTNVGSVPMYSHIVGIRHKQKYLEMRHGLRNLDKTDVVNEARRMEQREGRNLSDIQTILSDDRYPFPPGKGPERPVLPTSSFLPRGIPVSRGGDHDDSKESLSSNPVSKLLRNIAECAVKNEDDATMAFAVSSALITSLVAYKVKHIKHVDSASLVITNGDSLIENLKTIYNIPVMTESSSLAPRPTSHHRSRSPPTTTTDYDYPRRDDDDDYDRSSRKRRSPDRNYDSYYNDSYGRSRDYY